jgi:hypothetical protein
MTSKNWREGGRRMTSEETVPDDLCSVCGRRIQADLLCEYHHKALQNLRGAFNDWQHAMAIDWTTYLDRLEETEGVGDWVLEIIEFIKSQSDPSELTQPPT